MATNEYHSLKPQVIQQWVFFEAIPAYIIVF